MSLAVASIVAGQLVRSPVDETTSVLADMGLKLDSKTVSRIGYGVAERALAFRSSLLERMEAGLFGNLCAGMRLGVTMDGGRVRTRVPRGGKRRSTKRKRFKGDWREPKVFAIYELDEDGRRKRNGLRFYGGTMNPADDFFRLLSAYLASLGLTWPRKS